jgi:hypothetical protein
VIEVCRVIERDAEPEWGKALSAYERDREAADGRRMTRWRIRGLALFMG